MNKAQTLAPAVGIFKLTSLAAVLAFSTPVSALQFDKGEWSGSWDTTLSYGLGVRVQERDSALIGRANGGTSYSVNGDDGNLNFDKGDVFSNALKLSTELEINRGDYGAFFRVNAIYDDVLANDRVDNRPLGNVETGSTATGKRKFSDDAVDLAGQRIEFFDAFVYGNFEAGDKLGSWKLGNQVLSWGESTYIQNSINAVNPVDVSKLRVPGAELKEALIPVGLLSGQLELSENATLEAFYQINWRPFRIDPTGTLLSTNDFAGEGGFDHGALLRFGSSSDGNDDAFHANGATGTGLGADGIADFVVSRAPDEEARDDGQFGLAWRLYMPELNDTELGFYFMNYHSRLPVISGRSPSATRIQDAALAANKAYAAAPVNKDRAATGAYINALLAGDGAAQYFLGYPEDIQLYGVSFNASLGQTGVALQGELSHRTNVPLQIDDIELLVSVLGSTNQALSLEGGAGAAAAFNVMNALGHGGNMVDQNDQFPPGSVIPGFIERDVSQFQTTATKIFGNVMGAERLVLIGEAGFNYVHDMPKSRELPLDTAGTFLSSNAISGGLLHPCPTVGDTSCTPAQKELESFGDYADDFSWGYVVAGRLEYSNMIGAVNMKPKFSFRHDVQGKSPGPGGSFLEGRKAFMLGADFDYQHKWSGGISYTTFFGGGDQNVIADRDFVALNAKYSF